MGKAGRCLLFTTSTDAQAGLSTADRGELQAHLYKREVGHGFSWLFDFDKPSQSQIGSN